MLIKVLFKQGLMATINQVLDRDTAMLVVEDMGHRAVAADDSSVEDDLTDIMTKIVVDDWGQCLIGPFGCLRRHIDSGRVTQESIHGELGRICAGLLPGRESDEETILLWHRGLSTSDIALAHAMLTKADRLGIGHTLPYA